MKFFQNTSKNIFTAIIVGIILFFGSIVQSAFAQVGYPDYTIDPGSVSILTNPVRVGEPTVQIRATVRNIGPSSGGVPSETIVYIDRTSNISNAYSTVENTGILAPGGSEVETFTIISSLGWYPTAGTHTAIVCANYDGQVNESPLGYQNDCSDPVNFTIDPVDYIVTGLSVSPTSPTVGDTLTFSWNVENIGTGGAGLSAPTRLKINWGNDSVWDSILGNPDIGLIPPLAPGQVYPQSYSPGAGYSVQAGVHKIDVCADVTLSGVWTTIMESNEGSSGNCKQLNFIVSQPLVVPGCMDSNATNYNSRATEDDGSCTYAPVSGCTDAKALNYDPIATVDDGSCTYPPSPVLGCTDPDAINYSSAANQDDGSCVYDPKACVDTPADISGYAWSDAPDGSDECIVGQNAPCLSGGNETNLSSGRGAGWISLNGADGGTVTIDANGNLTGYGWSEHIGWINFNPDGPYPSGPGTTASGARVDISMDTSGNVSGSGQWSGWARAVSPIGDANAGGWDGWISLRGNLPAQAGVYGVTSNIISGVTTGEAWGDTVMGWVVFDEVRITPPVKCPSSIPGCMDPEANNYDASATVSDNSCTYTPNVPRGCMDPLANNYDASAEEDDGSCTYDPGVESCNGLDDDGDGSVDEGLDCDPVNPPESCPVPSVNALADTCEISWTTTDFSGSSCAIISQTGVTVGTGGSSGQKTLGSDGPYTVQCSKGVLRVSDTVSVSGCK